MSPAQQLSESVSLIRRKSELRNILRGHPRELGVLAAIDLRVTGLSGRTLEAHEYGRRSPSGTRGDTGYPSTDRATSPNVKSGLVPDFPDQGVFESVVDVDIAPGQVPPSREQRQISATPKQKHSTSANNHALDAELQASGPRLHSRVRQGAPTENAWRVAVGFGSSRGSTLGGEIRVRVKGDAAEATKGSAECEPTTLPGGIRWAQLSENNDSVERGR